MLCCDRTMRGLGMSNALGTLPFQTYQHFKSMLLANVISHSNPTGGYLHTERPMLAQPPGGYRDDVLGDFANSIRLKYTPEELSDFSRPQRAVNSDIETKHYQRGLKL